MGRLGRGESVSGGFGVGFGNSFMRALLTTKVAGVRRVIYQKLRLGLKFTLWKWMRQMPIKHEITVMAAKMDAT